MNFVNSSFFLAFFLITSLVSAGPQESFKSPSNIRESCRVQLSGIYLTHYDQLQVVNHEISVLDANHQSTLRRLQTLNQTLAQLKARGKGFDLKNDEAIISMEGQAAQISKQSAEMEQTLGDRRKIKLAAEERLAILKKLYAPLFELKPILQRSDEAYPFKLVYLINCPNYHYSCRLTLKQAASMKQMLTDLRKKPFIKKNEFPTSCAAYAEAADKP